MKKEERLRGLLIDAYKEIAQLKVYIKDLKKQYNIDIDPNFHD